MTLCFLCNTDLGNSAAQLCGKYYCYNALASDSEAEECEAEAECEAEECEAEEEDVNPCQICGVDMGACNPRQLCGKTFCHRLSGVLSLGNDDIVVDQ